MIPRKAVEAIHAAICEESLEDHMDPAWPGRCVKAAQAAAPHMQSSGISATEIEAVAHMIKAAKAEGWDEGQRSGMRHADRLVSAARIGRPELPGTLSLNPYRANE